MGSHVCPFVLVLISCGAAKEGGCSDVLSLADGGDAPTEQWFGWGALLHLAHLVHTVPSIPAFLSLHPYSPEVASTESHGSRQPSPPSLATSCMSPPAAHHCGDAGKRGNVGLRWSGSSKQKHMKRTYLEPYVALMLWDASHAGRHHTA